MLNFPLTIASGILGIWLADRVVAGVDFTSNWETLLLVGLVLGVANFFIKPILNLITLPAKILTLGLAGLLINVAIIWAIDIIFKELIIRGIVPLLWTTLIVWGSGTLLSAFSSRKKT